jgi:hypothetical protein
LQRESFDIKESHWSRIETSQEINQTTVRQNGEFCGNIWFWSVITFLSYSRLPKCWLLCWYCRSLLKCSRGTIMMMITKRRRATKKVRLFTLYF